MHHRFRSLLLILVMVSGLLVRLPMAYADHGGIHGIDPADMDLTVDPGVDFYRFANGGWLDRLALPGDRPSYGAFDALHDQTSNLIIGQLYELGASGTLTPESDEWKAVRLFQQGIDQATRDTQGISPILPIATEIDGIANLDDFHRFLVDARFKGVFGPFLLDAAPDLRDSQQTVVYLTGPWLGLPNRDYYVENDDFNQEIRDAYVKTSAKLLGFLGANEEEGRARAREVYQFERRMAETTLTVKEQQEISLFYNRRDVTQLASLYPRMNWRAMLDAHGLARVNHIIVTELNYLEQLDAIIRATPVSTLKDYLRLELMWNFHNNLSEEIEATAFEFYGRALNGMHTLNPLDHRVLAQLDVAMGDAVGKLYVAYAFSPEAKEQITILVEEIIGAFRARLLRNSWMSPATRVQALAKLDTLGVKVGYPEVWHTYETVEITDSYAMSALSAINADLRFAFSRVGQPLDRDHWELPPHLVTAYYDPNRNEIIFPAAILQPPFFDPHADPAANFGSIGFVIGHEITHGFDLTGSQFDRQGNLRNWWTDEDRARFELLNDRLATSYAAVEVLPGVFVDGQITVTENAADLGGIQVAYDALQHHLALHGRPVPPSDGVTNFSQEQRFFIAATTIWREQIRDEALITQIKSDPHAPAAVRGTEPLRHCDGFYLAFEIGPDDPLYLSPAERIVIW